MVGFWINETLYPGWGQRFSVHKTLAHVKSAIQDIVVVETMSHGRVMVLDGVVQVTQADEFIYQEMIAHVPLMAHGAAARVLIIGAGDGGVLFQVLRHKAVQSATMVEIDGDVIRLAREFLPDLGGESWSDPRAQVIIGDGVDFVAAASSASFDVIIVDSTDPIGAGEALFTDEFYRNCARVLTPEGVVVNQCGVPFMQAKELCETSRRRARCFSFVSAYLVAVPTYVGGFMTIGISSNTVTGLTLDAALIRERAAAATILGGTRYWSPEVHVASFALPPCISEHLPGRRAS